MRTMTFSLFLLIAVAALAQQPSSSQRLKEKFLSILRSQAAEWMTETTKQQYPQATEQDISERVNTFMPQVDTAYGTLLTLPEAEAKQLLTTGPDDKANMAAMQKDIELWKTVQLPMPAIYKQMQEKVVAGKIKGGLELELVRQISEFHLKQLNKLNP